MLKLIAADLGNGKYIDQLCKCKNNVNLLHLLKTTSTVLYTGYE
jgi:hypothetical protein